VDFAMKVKDCMCNQVNFVKPDTSVKECAEIMKEHHIGCTPVCDNQNTLVGIVTDRDIILRAVACDKNPATTPVSQIMTTKTCCCDANCDIEEAERIMEDEQIRRVPVIDSNKKVIGILTLGDIATNETIDEKEVCDTIEGICGCNYKNFD
jgi:CBS domain-containing protein